MAPGVVAVCLISNSTPPAWLADLDLQLVTPSPDTAELPAIGGSRSNEAGRPAFELALVLL